MRRQTVQDWETVINVGLDNARSLSNAQSHSTEWCIRVLDWEQTSSCSSDILYQLPPSTTIDSILLVQLTCLTVLFHTSVQVLFGLPLALEPFTSYTMHFFTQSSSFCNTFPYRHSLFCFNTSVMSSVPRSLSQLITRKSVFYLNATHPPDHSHLCSLKCDHIE